ncbi:MAG: DNA gyrase inhibitor YacG [Verrucomicrobiota bacterium]
MVKCPTCGKKGHWFATDLGPFCSRRCRLIDLGKWFDEDHRISERLRPDHLEDYEELPPGTYLDYPERD